MARNTADLIQRLTLGLMESLRILNRTLNDPGKMDEALSEIGKTIERGTIPTSTPDDASMVDNPK